MNLSPEEAEQSLKIIQEIAKKTRRTIANSGAYWFPIIWGIVWMLGFGGSHFLSQLKQEDAIGLLWCILGVLGSLLSILVGSRMNTGIRRAGAISIGGRILAFWLLLLLYAFLAIMVAQPVDGPQISMLMVLFTMVGWFAMGLLLSLGLTWPALLITALALIGYFFLPDIYGLWMAILGGGGMIALGLYIRSRW